MILAMVEEEVVLIARMVVLGTSVHGVVFVAKLVDVKILVLLAVAVVKLGEDVVFKAHSL